MRGALILLLFLLSGLTSCRNKVLTGELNTKAWKITVIQSDEHEKATNILSFKVRLELPRDVLNKPPTELINALVYQQGGSFFLTTTSTPTEASFVQPVNAGVSGVFEYLVEFDHDISSKKSIQMLFTDKHITHKQYTIELKK